MATQPQPKRPAGKEQSIYETEFTGGAQAQDPVQARGMELNDGRRNRAAPLDTPDHQDDVASRTDELQSGTALGMGTEHDMQELQNTGSARDPGAKKTLDLDDTPMEKRY